MNSFSTRHALLATTAGVLLLAACSGGDGDGGGREGAGGNPQANGSEIPLSATGSSAGALSFVKALVAAGGSESDEPLQLGADDVSLGNSETDDADPSV